MPVCNFAHMTSTHGVNVSARLLWMDFTVCSMIHNSQHQLHERHKRQLPQSWNLYISVHAFQLYSSLWSLASLHSRCLLTRLSHMNDFQTCKWYDDVRTSCLVFADRRLTCKRSNWVVFFVAVRHLQPLFDFLSIPKMQQVVRTGQHPVGHGLPSFMRTVASATSQTLSHCNSQPIAPRSMSSQLSL